MESINYISGEEAIVTFENGKITGYEITKPGEGYEDSLLCITGKINKILLITT